MLISIYWKINQKTKGKKMTVRVNLLILLVALAAACSSSKSKWQVPQHEATIPVPKNAEWWQKTQKEINKDVATKKCDLLFVGDSITHWFKKMPWTNEKTGGMTVWKEYYAHRNAINTGIMADKTQHVLWRLKNGNLKGLKPKLTVIMIGTNNTGNQETPQQTADGIRAIIECIHEKCPKSKILLLGIFPKGEKKNNKGQIQNANVNKIISGYDKIYPFLTYLDISKKFLKADGSVNKDLLRDYLHPNAKGYKVWAEAMEPTIQKLLK